jgi:transcriptional regulator of acetoin/glycerol metabolism
MHAHRAVSSPAAPVPHRESPDAVTPLAELEQAILEALQQLKGDKLRAAKLLGIGKTTLYRKLKEYGLGESVAGL